MITQVPLGEWKRTNYVRYRAIVMVIILVGSIIFYSLPTTTDVQHILSLVVAAFCILVVVGDFSKAIRPAVTVTLYSEGITVEEGRGEPNVYKWADVTNGWWPGMDLNKPLPQRYRHSYGPNAREVDNAIDTARAVATVGKIAENVATGGHFKDQLTLEMSNKQIIQLDKSFNNVQTLIAQIHELLTDDWAIRMQRQLGEHLTVKFGAGSLTFQTLRDEHSGIPWANITDTRFSETMGTLTVQGTDSKGASQRFDFNGVGIQGEAVIKLIKKVQEQPITTPQQVIS